MALSSNVIAVATRLSGKLSFGMIARHAILKTESFEKNEPLVGCLPLGLAMPRDADRRYYAEESVKKQVNTQSCRGTATIYHEAWWLDIATQNSWEIVSVNQSGRCIAWMPYALKKRHGITVNVMPEATNFLGPVLESSPGGPSAQLRRQISLTAKLISELPKVHWFSQLFHAEVDNVMAFQEAGYTATVRHSVLVDASSKEIAWRNMRDKTRNSIRQSEKTDQVVTIDDPQEFVNTYQNNLNQSGLKAYVDFGVIRFLVQETMRRNRGKIIGLRDPRGNLHSAIFYIWDEQTAYYNLSTRSISQSNHGAISHLIWAAIQDALSNDRTFDFDGVVKMGAGRLYSGFGGRVVSRLGVEKGSDLYTLSNSLLRFLARRARRQMV